MNPTNQSLLAQMSINQAEIVRRKELLGFDEADARRLSACEGFVADEVDGLVSQFYAQQTAVDEIAVIIGDADTLSRLQQAMTRYVTDLFSGVYGEDYVNNRLRIGLVHKRIGVSPKYYLSAMHLLKSLLLDVLRRNIGDYEEFRATALALDKLLYLDNEFVFDTYIRSMLAEIQAAKEAAVEHASHLEEKVAERTRELEALARKDALTSLYNRRHFLAALQRELTRARRAASPMSLVYFDLDGFKAVNDSLGHLAGDEMLRQLAQLLSAQCRSYDLACRYGGDEFCVLLPDTTLEAASAFAQRLQEAAQGASGHPMRLSIGLVQIGPDHWVDTEAAIEAADRAMYTAKRQGGGRQVAHQLEA